MEGTAIDPTENSRILSLLKRIPSGNGYSTPSDRCYQNQYNTSSDRIIRHDISISRCNRRIPDLEGVKFKLPVSPVTFNFFNLFLAPTLISYPTTSHKLDTTCFRKSLKSASQKVGIGKVTHPELLRIVGFDPT